MVQDRKKEPSPSGKTGGHASTGTGPAFQHYMSAVQLLQQGKFEKALAAFEKLLPAAPIELLDRCKMYISTCQRQLEQHRLWAILYRHSRLTILPFIIHPSSFILTPQRPSPAEESTAEAR